MDAATYRFRFNPAFRAASAAVGVTPSNSSVLVRGDELRVRFGRWTVRTPLANVETAEVTGPYSWPKVIGPPALAPATCVARSMDWRSSTVE